MTNDYHGRYLTPPGGWPVGPAEEPPAPIAARPYEDEPDPLDFVRLGEQLDDADFAAAHDSVRVRPEIAAAIQAAADEDSTGATVLSLDDIAASGRAAFQRFLDAEITKAEGDHLRIPPGYDIAVSCDPVGNAFDSNRVAFKITGTPPKFTLDDFVDTLQRTLPLPETVKLTVEQLLAVRSHTPPPAPWEPDRALWGVPVEIVETVEESTPYQWRHSTPGPLRFDRELTDEQLAEFVEMMKTPGKFIEFAAPRMGITQPIPDLHRAVVIAEVTAAPEPRRSIGGRLWQALRRWSR